MTLTKTDLSNIEQIVEKKLEEKLDNKLTNLKSEFFEKIDPVLKEVTTTREERILIESRLEKLEGIHPDGKHVFAE